MTDLQKVKISISILLATGVVKSQEELSKLMGYKSKSAFSQVVNGIVPIPKGFIDKMKSLDKNITLFWENEFGGQPNLANTSEIRKLELENKRLMSEIIDLQRMLLDKSLSPDKNIIND